MDLQKVTAKEMAEFLFANVNDNPRIEFYADYDEENDDARHAYKASVIRYADSNIVLINYYGGGAMFARDITDDETSAELQAELEKYFTNQGFYGSVWAEELRTNGWICIEAKMPTPYMIIRVQTANLNSRFNGMQAFWTGRLWVSIDGHTPISAVTHWQEYIPEEI